MKNIIRNIGSGLGFAYLLLHGLSCTDPFAQSLDSRIPRKTIQSSKSILYCTLDNGRLQYSGISYQLPGNIKAAIAEHMNEQGGESVQALLLVSDSTDNKGRPVDIELAGFLNAE